MTLTEQSFQARARDDHDVHYTADFLSWAAAASDLLPPWWSKARDVALTHFWRQSDLLSGAIYTIVSRMTSVPVYIKPRDPNISTHVRQADDYMARLVEASEFGSGWSELFGRWLMDYFTQDNGAFMEVIGDGRPDGAIEGPALGLASLDSSRCTRTGNPTYPVVYRDTDGRVYKLHATRVVYKSQLSSTRVEMHGVGFCALSRCLNFAQTILDDLTYKSEKMGSRPMRAILVGKGITADIIKTAVEKAAVNMDATGLKRYAKIPLVGNASRTDIGIDRVDLSDLPDGFDYQTDVTLAVYAIALAFGVPARWIWTATQTGATKADAEFQHIAGLSQGAAEILSSIQYLLGGSPDTQRTVSAHFLPPHLKLVFDYIDDEQDARQASIRSTRAETRAKNLGLGVTTTRLEREAMRDAGELTEAQFEDLELASGRLPDGSDALALFYDPAYVAYLDLGVSEPTNPALQDAGILRQRIAERQVGILRILATGTSSEIQRARWAQSALNRLTEIYEPHTQTAAQTVQTEGGDTAVLPAQPPAGTLPPSGTSSDETQQLTQAVEHAVAVLAQPSPLLRKRRRFVGKKARG